VWAAFGSKDSGILQYMEHMIVGLGNPSARYEQTLHNIGRMVVERYASGLGVEDWVRDGVTRALRAVASSAAGDPVSLVLPDDFMNRSGYSVAQVLKDGAAIARLVVVHDDIDLPMGSVKVQYDRGAGGHNGVRSIERSIGSHAFTRVRVGVLPVTRDGVVHKPRGGAAVERYILRELSEREQERVERVVAYAAEALVLLIEQGAEEAMRTYNGEMLQGVTVDEVV